MHVPLLLLASLCATSPTAPPRVDPEVAFSRTMEQRSARLLEGLELAATWKPSLTPPLRLTDALRFDVQGTPAPLDTGGGVSAGTRQVLALVLGLVIGFGLGHLVARDREGFVLFLVVDIAIIAAMVVLGNIEGVFWGLGAVGLLVSHIIQGLDAYGEAGGPRIIELTRERTLQVADAGGREGTAAPTTRVLQLSF